ncbi:hypothetical protein J5N97_005055 [Dioscorea zingiberensis]|uniref:BRCT domain-containing protein n=1 Tax=Dioscorea zingiberensis TaxID=325984 RepID=A0A9D5D8E6_9LILI|nr:hypothetical protein J5N97_005055 [Dioscorea zingiberensis]
MAPRTAKSKKQSRLSIDPHGIFNGMVVFLVPMAIQPRRLQIWKQKLLQMGAVVDDSVSKRTTHIFSANSSSLLQVNRDYLKQFKGKLLLYEWLENCLQSGKRLSEDPYILKSEPDGADKSVENLEKVHFESPDVCSSEDDCFDHKRIKVSCEDPKPVGTVGNVDDQRSTDKRDMNNKIKDDDKIPSLYSPPDLNRNITEIFGKLIDIYRGDERRSFSYYKAIPVIEKLPYKIESVDQVKHLPTIGKSMQDHVRTITLFGEVWGIGPATALKLYEIGHRNLDDLKNDDSLTNSQRIGLQFFHDIKKRIPRHEVKDMEMLLQKVGEEVLQGGTDSGVDTYFGLCTYPGQEQRHRIDLKVYPRSIYAFGLIAWTGNDVLNRRLRLLAESKGYRLDDTGLYLAAQSSGGKRVHSFNHLFCKKQPMFSGACVLVFDSITQHPGPEMSTQCELHN